jgi:hypothetical protein
MKPIKLVPLGEIDTRLLSRLGIELRSIFNTEISISIPDNEPAA